MALALSTSSNGVLYLYQVLSKYLKGFRVTDLNSRVDTRVVANVDGRTYRRTYTRKTGSQYRAMPEAGTTKISDFFQQTILPYLILIISLF